MLSKTLESRKCSTSSLGCPDREARFGVTTRELSLRAGRDVTVRIWKEGKRSKKAPELLRAQTRLAFVESSKVKNRQTKLARIVLTLLGGRIRPAPPRMAPPRPVIIVATLVCIVAGSNSAGCVVAGCSLWLFYTEAIIIVRFERWKYCGKGVGGGRRRDGPTRISAMNCS